MEKKIFLWFMAGLLWISLGGCSYSTSSSMLSFSTSSTSSTNLPTSSPSVSYEIEDEEEPEWEVLSVDYALSSNGTPWYGLFRKGSENKLVVFFFGGGLSFSLENSQQGSPFFVEDIKGQDTATHTGIASLLPENPFRNWSILMVPYGTGDIHSGTNTYSWIDEQGEEQVVYHTGYLNYDGLLNIALPLVGEPEDLVIAGSSAGGLATAFLANDLIERIPSAQNVVICVDSGFLVTDSWKEIAQDVWQSPSPLIENLNTSNLTLDGLLSLYEKYPTRVKILFICSYRDGTLTAYQSYLDQGTFEISMETANIFQRNLQEMTQDLQNSIPSDHLGIYLWTSAPTNTEAQTTRHQVLNFNEYYFFPLEDNITPAQWIYEAIESTPSSHGLYLVQ